MSRTTKYGIVVGTLASPLLLFAIVPLLTGPPRRGLVVGGVVFVLAWAQALRAARASARARESPTAGAFARESGQVLIVGLLIVLGMLAYGNL